MANVTNNFPKAVADYLREIGAASLSGSPTPKQAFAAGLKIGIKPGFEKWRIQKATAGISTTNRENKEADLKTAFESEEGARVTAVANARSQAETEIGGIS